MIAKRRISLPVVLGLLAWTTILAGPAASRSFGPFELPVVVEESPGLARLHVFLPEETPAAAVEVEIAGRTVVVQCQAHDGLFMRSRPIRLSQAVSAADIDVGFAADGSLTITLHAAEGGS